MKYKLSILRICFIASISSISCSSRRIKDPNSSLTFQKVQAAELAFQIAENTFSCAHARATFGHRPEEDNLLELTAATLLEKKAALEAARNAHEAALLSKKLAAMELGA